MSTLPFDQWVIDFREREPATKAMKVCLDADENYNVDAAIKSISPEAKAHFSFEVEIHGLLYMGFSEEEAISMAREATQERYDKGYFK